MAKEYRPLPDGPVVCEVCARTGHNIQMQPHEQLPPEAMQWAEDEDTELQSYRCPSCEGIEVFRVD